MANKRGSPYFMYGRRERIRKLEKILNSNNNPSHKEVEKILAIFAIENDLRIDKVREYYNLLKLAGKIE